MTGLFVSQNVSENAPQQEVDRIAKGQKEAMQAQGTQEEVFFKVLDRSMREVNELASSEREDPLLRDAEKEDQEEEN